MPAELTVWEDPSHGHRIVLHPGSALTDVMEWLQLPAGSCVGCSVLLRVNLAGIDTNVSLGLWRESHGCKLRGQVYMDHLLHEIMSPHEGAASLLDFCKHVAIDMHLDYLSVSREGDMRRHMDHATGIVFPTLFGVFSESALGVGDVSRLVAAGISVTRLTGEWSVIWTMSVDELLAGHQSGEAACRVFERYSIPYGGGDLLIGVPLSFPT